MSAFIFACAGLLVLSGLFYLFPRRRPTAGPDDQRSANLEWYRLRQGELSEADALVLQRDAQLRLLEDDAQSDDGAAPESEPDPVSGSFPRWSLFPVIAVAAIALYYQLGSAPDVIINKQLKGLVENSPQEQVQVVLQAIEARSAQRPDNLHYSALLGRFYMGQQDYSRAAQLYGELATVAPEDSQALALAAQAEYLSNDRVLSERAQMWAEQALAIDPHQRTALGLLGMASFEQNEFRAAIDYWQRLLAMEQPGSEGAQMIASVIERAKLGMAGGGEQSAAAEVGQGSASPHGSSVASASSSAGTGVSGGITVTPGVTVRVSIPQGADISLSDTVFVLARGANSSSRMPVAVQRLQADQLPMTIRLDDSKSMAGQKLSETESIVVVVQVSPDGRPGEAAASWLGRAGPLAPSLDTEPLDIELRRRES